MVRTESASPASSHAHRSLRSRTKPRGPSGTQSNVQMISSFICSCLYSKSQSADRSALPACTCQQTKGQREQEVEDTKEFREIQPASGRPAPDLVQCHDAKPHHICR